MDEKLSSSLLQFMVDEEFVPSCEEDDKRKNVILKLKQIVTLWAKKIAWQRGFPKQDIAATSATLLTYGSYGLGVHSPGSDIDVLCAGPCFMNIEDDFFTVLNDMLRSRPEVSWIHCMKGTKVPLLRFKFEEIFIDLSYAQYNVLDVPESVDILDPFLVRNIDHTWKSLSRVCNKNCILQLVPDLKNFQSMLRCLRLWAKRRGVYGNLFGYLGGIHLAVLAAYVCQRNPNASLNALVMNFFQTFAAWQWPTPVVLQDGALPIDEDAAEAGFFMPIQIPCSPLEYFHTNITRSTFYRIRSEFLRGHTLMRDISNLGFDWGSVFETFPYLRKYARFIKIDLSSRNQDELQDWVGCVKSQFHCLLLKLEELQGLCDPNPTEYVDMSRTEPNVVFYWGLQPSKNNVLDMDAVKKEFMKNIGSECQGRSGKMALAVVPASELAKSGQFGKRSGKSTKACWKIFDCDKRTPVNSQHLPHYIVGYMASDGAAELLADF